MRKIYNYKGVRVNSFGIPVFFGSKDSKKFEKRDKKKYHIFLSEFNENSVKDLILMYDIPSKKKKERDWFRRHLKKFGYVMIQKSVWVGPSPLPKDFLKYVDSIGLRDKLKALKLVKAYNEKDVIL